MVDTRRIDAHIKGKCARGILDFFFDGNSARNGMLYVDIFNRQVDDLAFPGILAVVSLHGDVPPVFIHLCLVNYTFVRQIGGVLAEAVSDFLKELAADDDAKED